MANEYLLLADKMSGVVGSKTSDWAGKTFTIELKRHHSHPGAWLVASWVPKGIGGAGQIRSVAAFYGGLQGVAGGALQPVAVLELPPTSAEEPGPLALAS